MESGAVQEQCGGVMEMGLHTYLIKCTSDLCSSVLAQWIKVLTKCSSEQHWALSRKSCHYVS